MDKILTILLCSRVFSLPMTIFSWLVIFVFSLINYGNIFYGLLALIGLIFVHLGANLVDDYIDYKFMIKQVNFDKNEYLKNTQKTKCRYLIKGIISENNMLSIIFIYFSIAFLTGVFFFFKVGHGMLIFAIIGAFIALTYPLASRFCLSEILIGLAYGPALFGGVYYVMCGKFSWETIILSLPTMFATIILLYIHTVMDYNFDKNEGKKTLSNIFSSQEESLVILKIFLILAYLSPFLLSIIDIMDWQCTLVLFTIPLALDLYKSIKQFAINSDEIPKRKWFHYPMEQLNLFKERGEAAFMMRMYQARNFMVYYSILFIIGMLCAEIL